MTPEPATYPGYRFPAEIIGHAVWLYHVFSLSLRDVELILAERGIGVTHESIRQWCLRFGAGFARRLRRRRPRPGDTWHLDEVYLRINGVLHYLWRAVDQNGVALDILVQGRRNATAAKRFFKRLLAGLRYRPKRIVTDGLRSYGAARREVLPDVRHRTSRYLNNRAENSHRPTRRRERQMHLGQHTGERAGACLQYVDGGGVAGAGDPAGGGRLHAGGGRVVRTTPRVHIMIVVSPVAGDLSIQEAGSNCTTRRANGAAPVPRRNAARPRLNPEREVAHATTPESPVARPQAHGALRRRRPGLRGADGLAAR